MTKIGLQATLNVRFKLLLKIGVYAKILYSKMQFLGQVLVMHSPHYLTFGSWFAAMFRQHMLISSGNQRSMRMVVM